MQLTTLSLLLDQLFGIIIASEVFNMKNLKLCVLPFAIALLLTSCGGQSVKTNIKLIDPEDTSMLSANCKKYIDDMREQEQKLDDPYKWNALDGEGCVDIDETNLDVNSDERQYLDKGDVNGQNKTVNGQIPDRSDKSLGVELKFDVKAGYEAEEYRVLVCDDNTFNRPIELTTKENSVRVKNLLVNKIYYWKVIAGDEESSVGEFTTGDYPRWIDARPMFNVRDMGGYMTDSGKRVKQGLIFRGGEIVKQAWNEHLVTYSEASKKAFRETMDMVNGVELDLRKTDGQENEQGRYTSCAFAENNDIEFLPLPIGSYGNTIKNNSVENRAELATY